MYIPGKHGPRIQIPTEWCLSRPYYLPSAAFMPLWELCHRLVRHVCKTLLEAYSICRIKEQRNIRKECLEKVMYQFSWSVKPLPQSLSNVRVTLLYHWYSAASYGNESNYYEWKWVFKWCCTRDVDRWITVWQTVVLTRYAPQWVSQNIKKCYLLLYDVIFGKQY